MAAVLGVILLSACASVPQGAPSSGFVDSHVAAAYVPLNERDWLLREHWGAALKIGPGVAVTNAHNANLVPKADVLATSRDYDLLFYRPSAVTNQDDWLRVQGARVAVNDEVVAYGQFGKDLREAKGVVRAIDGEVAPLCAECPVQRAIAFDAPAGPGFSGGPLVEAKTGTVVGLVFGYRDGEAADGGRRMFAYDMALVLAEMRRLLPPKTP